MNSENSSILDCLGSLMPYKRLKTTYSQDTVNARALLNEAGIIMHSCPSAILADAYLKNVLNKSGVQTACHTGFLRYSQTTKHHLALSFIDSESNIQHQDLSEILETHAHIILSFKDDMPSLISWVKKQCKQVRDISDLIMSESIFLLQLLQ